MTDLHSEQSGHFGIDRLRQVFEPRSIALVGASEKSMWSQMVHHGMARMGFGGELYYVNPNSPTVHGQPTVASLEAIGKPVDLAFVMVNNKMVPQVLEAMGASGTRNAVILASGFAEVGEEGRQRQAEMVRLAEAHDLALIGPNCLGFANLTVKTPAMPSLEGKLRAGAVGIASQSGAIGNLLTQFAAKRGIGVSAMISSGNEAVLAVNDSLEYLVHDPNTKAIAMFMESVRHPEAFQRVARQAQAQGKPIVALKAGRSRASQRVAQAHTGALTGDDQVIDALFGQLGILRVDSLEELMVTAHMLGVTGRLPGRRAGFMAISGGLCGIAADIGEAAGLEFPEWSEGTKASLKELLPEIEMVENPFDSTGVPVNNPPLMAQLLDVLQRDPNIDVLITPQGIPEAGSVSEAFVKSMLDNISGIEAQGKPILLTDNTDADVHPKVSEYLETLQFPVIPAGIALSVRALGHVARWSGLKVATTPADPAPITVDGDTTGAWSEHQARELLAQHGVPVIPSELASTPEGAAQAAAHIGFPVALKIVSKDILHKSDIGGVKLNLKDEAAVREAFAQVMQAAQIHAPQAQVDGVLVSPMRSGGTELLVGIVRDPNFGQVLAVGLGGIYVEVFKDAALHVLPATREDIRGMLDRLQGKALLEGVRGTKAANLDTLTEAIFKVAQLAQGLGERLESLEINPLVVDGDQVEALDAVLTWQGTPASH